MSGKDEPVDATNGTVDWYDADRCVGSIRPDDGGPPCKVGSDALRDCGIESLEAGDRVRFRAGEEAGERTASDLARIRAFDRWENEGGAVNPG